MKIGIRTADGTRWRTLETRVLEATSTAVVASPIPSPLVADAVTAIAGHIASNWPAIMLLSHKPSRRIFR